VRHLRVCDVYNYNVITAMKTDLVRIGNSRGIRIPKPVIEQCGLGDTVEMRVEKNRLVIFAERKPRQGWEDALRRAVPATEDEPLLDSTLDDDFDNKEWTW